MKFFRGSKNLYSEKDHVDAIYFATDTKEIIMNGNLYTGPKQSKCELYWMDVVGSIEEAFSNGGMVALKNDIELSESLVVESGVYAIVDLNNHAINNSSTEYDSSAIIVKEGATLIIKGQGNINGGSGCITNTAIRIKGGKCEIQSGSFTVGTDINNTGNFCIEVERGSLEISGGEFSADVIKDNMLFNGNNISITGGTFKNFNPEKFVANGYKSTLIKSTNDYKVIAL